jgi:hypothetical protein
MNDDTHSKAIEIMALYGPLIEVTSVAAILDGR